MPARTHPIAPRPPRRAPSAVARRSVLALAVVVALACAPAAFGPPFRSDMLRPPSAPETARVVVYRSSGPPASASAVRVTIDGRALGRFRPGEFETLELPAGPHRLRAGLRGFAYLQLGWNELSLRLRPGETRYVRLESRIAESRDPIFATPRELSIAGQPERRGSENVYLIEPPSAQALQELEGTTRVLHSD